MMRAPLNQNLNRRQDGLNLIELMISLTLGLMLITAVLSVFLSSNRNFVQDDQVSRMQENGRFSMKRLEQELVMANFWGGMTNVSDILTASIALGKDCSVDFDPKVPGDSLIVSLDPALFPCISDHVADTPIILVKRIEGGISSPQVAGKPYLLTNGAAGRLSVHVPGDTSTEPNTGENAWEYMVRLYYIRSVNNAGVKVPTLYMRVMEPVGGAFAFNEYELADGIENMRFEFAIDTNADDIPDQYTETPSSSDMRKAVSGRLFVLTRSIAEDQNYTDEKTYFVGQYKFEPKSDADPTNDKFRRRIFSKTIIMRNTAYLAHLN